MDPVAAARALLHEAERVLVITGAGMSAESGVPTFRGEGEKWRDRHFTDLATPEAFAAEPRLIWDWYLYRRNVVVACKPHAGHQRLAEWATSRSGTTLVTQNVDGLHEDAGHPNVQRIHGSLWHNRCTACGLEREDRSLIYEALPLSPCCNAPERPAIVWFGERLASKASQVAVSASVHAQVVLVVGTSGIVSTAGSFVRLARQVNARVLEVNPARSELFADLWLPGGARQMLTEVLSP